MHDLDTQSIEDARHDPSTTSSSTITNEETVDVSLKAIDSKKEQDVEVAAVQATPEFTFPEGGWRAWSTVLGGFLVQFACFGYINSFGVYEDFYVRQYLTKFSTSQIGWIGGVQIFLNFAPGIFAGRLFDRGYFWHLITTSIIIYAVSLYTLSLAHENSYYQIFLTNGVGLGLSSGLTYAATLGLPGHYFKRRRAIAVGIVSSGSAIGGIIHPIMLNKLINGHIGFRNAVRISASMNVALLILAACLMRTRLPPKPKAQEFPVMQWLKEPAYLFLVLSGIPCFIGLFFPPFYIQLNAITHGVDKQFSFYAIAILNAGSYVGRILPALLSRRFGVFNLGTINTTLAGVVCITLIWVKSAGGTVAYALVYGVLSGTCVALTPAMFAQITKDPTEFGTRFGIYLGVAGLVGLFATSILGALLTSDYHWARPSLLAGFSLIAAGLCYGTSRFFVVRQHGTHRV